MNPSVVVVDYGLGNLFSASTEVSDSPARIDAASHVILPGVGAFTNGMQGLRSRGLVEPLRRFAASGRPMLGICLGMQLLFEESEEFGRHEGIGLVAGRVVAIPPADAGGRSRKIPHIGWSALQRPGPRPTWRDTILAGLELGTFAYFVHSYTAVPQREADRLADCDYDGCRISAAIARDHLYGCQFHPEKSGPAGLAVLRTFVKC
jgi:glutamine amidotransferase